MNKLLIVLFTVLNTIAFSQVTVTTTSGLINGNNPFNSCSTVNLGSNSSVSISLGVNLSKPYNQSTGDFSYIKLRYRSNSSGPDLFTNLSNIMESYWNNPGSGNATYSTSVVFTLNAADFNTSGGSFDIVFVSSSNVVYSSCTFPVIKDLIPTFSLSPTNVTIPCGDMSPRTFTVNAANIPNGASVTYNWIWSGWSGNYNNTMSSVTLTPTSPFSLPSSVIVVPYVNGIAQPSKSCSVSRSSFTTTASISGNPVICIGNSDTYVLNGLGSGNTVTWSTSNPSISSVSSPTGNQVTVNAISNGLIQLIATITNPCGQVVTITKSINLGAPDVSNGVDAKPLWLRKNFLHVLNSPSTLGALSYIWTIVPDFGFPCAANTTQARFTANGAQTIVTSTPSVQINSGSCINDYVVTCTATNICGSTIVYERYLTVGASGSSPCNTLSGGLVANFIVQNPVNKEHFVVKRMATTTNESEINDRDITYQPGIIANDGPCEGPYPAPVTSRSSLTLNDLEDNQFELKLYDLMGKLVFSGVFEFNDNNEYQFQNVDLKVGKYILNITNNESSFREIILVEE